MAALLLLKSLLLSKALQKSKKRKKPNKKMKTKAFSYRSGTETCRVCSQSTADIPIFNNHLEPHLAEEILHFSGVLIQESDKLTKFMCQSCYDLLHGCILFRDMCQRTDKAFHKAHKGAVKVKTEIRDDLEPPDGGGDSSSEDTARGSDDSYQVPSPVFSDTKLRSCAVCCKDFNNLPSYNKHLPMCKARIMKSDRKGLPEGGGRGGKKRFLCDTCGQTTLSKAHLLVHMSTHDNTFPFKCDVCPYKGRNISLLKVHKRSHLVDKPFKCTLCPKATTTSSNLATHMRNVHTTSRPFKCPNCEKFFKTKPNLKGHVDAVHENRGNTECEVCHKVMRKEHLRTHLWRVHKIQTRKPTLPNKLPSYILCNRASGQSHQQHTEHNDGNQLTNGD